MAEGEDYFEGQSAKDCVLHSLNNAFGKKVVEKDQVLKHLEEVIKEYRDSLEGKGLSSEEIEAKVARKRNKSATKNTFFAADLVWDTAKQYGAFSRYVPIPGMADPFLKIENITPEVSKFPIVILGGDENGGTHAIAVRNGLIYDSERKKEDGAVPLTKTHLKKSLPRVFGAYAFLPKGVSPKVVSQVDKPFKSFES